MSMSPILCYEDTRKAMDWLCEAFGFEKKEVHENDDGELEHVELKLGDGIIMIGDQRLSRFGMKPPADGSTTGGIYVTVEDPDALHDRAKAAGAEITMGLTDQEYGSREFMARDIGGHVWSFGTYKP